MLHRLNTGEIGSKRVITTSTLKSHKTVPMLIITLKIVHMLIITLKIVHMLLNSVKQLRTRVTLTGSRMIPHILTFKRGNLRRSAMVMKVMVVNIKGFPWMLMVRNNQELLSRLLRRNGQS